MTQERIRSADLIFVTHEHFDHCDHYDIERIVDRTNAFVVGPIEALSLIESRSQNKMPVNEDDIFSARGVDIEVVEARHPQSTHPVGFVVRCDGKSIYFAGDTYEFIAMREIEVDTAVLPISGGYAMDSIGAANSLKKLTAKYAVPCQFGTFPGITSDARLFRGLVSESKKSEPVVLQVGEGFEF